MPYTLWFLRSVRLALELLMTVYRSSPVTLFCMMNQAMATPLDDALNLVLLYHPSIAQKQIIAEETAQQTDWEAKVRLGYSYKETTTESMGPNASFMVNIPLFSRKRQIEHAKARLAVSVARDQVRSAFLAEFRSLKTLANDHYAAQQRYALQQDKLQWYKKAVEEGRLEADVLWTQAEATQSAELKARETQQQYQTVMTIMARQYAREQWKTLQDLLAAAVK